MTRDAGTFEQSGEGRWSRLPALTSGGLRHGFSCRDLDGPGGPAEALGRALGLAGVPLATLRQEHTDTVLEVGSGPWPSPPPVGDALVSRGSSVRLAVSTADCVPLILTDPGGGGFAVVHAGWRGTCAGILQRTMDALSERFGTDPRDLWVGVGPCIRACCYEVGTEVQDAFASAWASSPAWFRPRRGHRPHLDLVAANRAQARQGGMVDSRFVDPGWCTRCDPQRFYSYRADGPGTGRIITLAARPLPLDAGSG